MTPSFLQGPLSVLARLCLCTLFLERSLANMIPRYSGFLKSMRAEGFPNPKLLLPSLITLAILGSTLVILGFKARIGALLLLVFLGISTYYAADFWHLSADMQEKQAHFIKNIGLVGAMLLIVANGPGAGSFDRSR